MRMREIQFTDGLPIDGYGPGFFRVGGQIHSGPTLVLPAGAESWGGFDDIARLIEIADRIDVLFIGTGPEMAPLPEPFRSALEEAGIGVEAMASGSACRTYNVLLSEGRRVAAALIPV